ncbi:MAG TPA: methyl-accepting chemotaxis protein [Oxalicibacterium sp.]|uniref:methyl-accepting chemotaxis protein n=1 Tax=Oxalicibacterium sp. TaxID=2766525 RepID=UPI002C6B5C14|nr:methyl-accepting chemotaxis protein [Oxalicibacterium sp.]HWU98844.1 methyl-accepting chemotaxis protein [Oxalicibacterium sp.]
MSFLSNFRIGTRLAIGFTMVIALSVASTAIALIHARQNAEATRLMMEEPLTKERITSDWYVFIYSAIARTAMIARSSDDKLSEVFADVIADSTKQGSGLLKSLEPLIANDEERKLLDASIALRKVYQKAKEDVMSAKSSGNKAEGERVFNEVFMPAAKAYQEKVKEFLSFQRKEIDNISIDIAAAHQRSWNLMVALGVLMLLLGATCAFLITRSITRPLKTAIDVASRAADGDLTSEISKTSKDEIGDLMRALESMNSGLKKIVMDVKSGTDFINNASAEIASGNLDLSSRTEQQAASLEETASSMEELTSTVKQNAENAQQANQLAVSASTVAAKGGAVVKEMIDTMGAIDGSSRKIVDIIGVIDGIAFQTNILALNAAVEAARAGEQGRGFAVVAAEVRSLAQRSAGAAKEIKGLIDDSVNNVDAGSKLVTEAGRTMDDVVSSIRHVTDIMNEIMAASQEQSSGIEQVNTAIGQMDQVTQQNAALVEEAAAASQSLRDQADKLAQVVSVFKIDDNAVVSSTTKHAALSDHSASHPAINYKAA